jgi:hypothetical protein
MEPMLLSLIPSLILALTIYRQCILFFKNFSSFFFKLLARPLRPVPGHGRIGKVMEYSTHRE